MSEFRERVSNDLIQAVGHPIPAHAGLRVLHSAMREKITQTLDTDAPKEFVEGLKEASALISNLRYEMARDYGIEEEK